jgi:hypothetical protein
VILLQLDLFADDTLRIARPHARNPLCLLDEDCHFEKHEKPGMKIGIGIGRTERGYFNAIEFQYSYGGTLGPVFINGPAYSTFQEARAAAKRKLRAFAEKSFSNRSGGNG